MKKVFFYTLLTMSIWSNLSFAQDNQVRLEHTERFNLTSNVIDDEYEIQVALPLGYERSEAHYKTLYVLDANVTFGMVRDIQTLVSFEPGNPPLIVVGIAYKNLNEWLRKRARDYKPTNETKGITDFTKFIERQLIPEIEEKYRANGERLIYGHSTAGLYGLYTLMTKTNLFNGYIMTSPSVDEDNGVTLNAVENPSVKLPRPTRLYISIGSKEKESFQQAFKTLTQSLESGFDNLVYKAETIDGTHMSTMSTAFIKGLQFVNNVK